MRVLIVVPDGHPGGGRALSRARVTVDGHRVDFALVEVPDEAFDPGSPDHEHQVLVRVRAFSLNYRDRALVREGARLGASGPDGIGSEFAASVVAAGRVVEHLRPGDRVIGEMSWPGSGTPGAVGGVPTNHASRELLVLHARKLLKIPPSMPDHVAAAFGLGAQTAYSMVRRLAPVEGASVLVTAASSSTGLFALQALRRAGVVPYALTRRAALGPSLRAYGAEEVFALEEPRTFDEVRRWARRHGGFDAVVDPFADRYLRLSLSVLGFFGRYVTCGLAAQGGQPPGEDGELVWDAVATALITKNITVIGNCLGQPEDLTRAMADWEDGRLDVPLDSVHRGPAIEDFLTRTLCAGDRCGKVVYVYD